MDFSRFHVLTCVSNPVQYQTRYKLHNIFEEDLIRKGGTLWTVEMQTGQRPHKVTAENNRRQIQLHSSAIPGELWHKENLLNIGLQHIARECPNFQTVMWSDADIKYEPGALEKIADHLDHFDVVQCWSHAIDLGPDGEALNKIHQSYMYCYWHGIDVKDNKGYLHGGHPGFAWAARRDSLNKLGTALGGPLIDWGVLGSGDRHMAGGLTGNILQTVHGDINPGYRRWLERWQDGAEKYIKRNVSYVPNTIRHMWHGRKADRGYASRWQILVKHQFNPETDLARDVSGIWRLIVDTPRQMAIRDDFRKYFRARREDATTNH